MIPFLKEDVMKIPNTSVIPAGVATQWTISDKGERIIKRRPTHDASRPGPSGLSVNNRCDKELLDECLIGHCLLRLLHQVHALRLLHPSIHILFNKTDLDAAYRRLHVALAYALLCITIISRIAYLLVRLPFGTTPAADEFCTVSESITDLSQAIADDKTWNPTTLKSDQCGQIPEPSLTGLEDIVHEVPFPLLVPIIPKSIYMDVYIDDIITIVLYLHHLIEKANKQSH